MIHVGHPAPPDFVPRGRVAIAVVRLQTRSMDSKKRDEKPSEPQSEKPKDFAEFVRKIVSVPKSELEQQEKQYQDERKKRRKK